MPAMLRAALAQIDRAITDQHLGVHNPEALWTEAARDPAKGVFANALLIV